LTVSGISYPLACTGNWAGGSVGANRSQPVTVTFTPAAAGTHDGIIVVNFDKTSGDNTIPCAGAGMVCTDLPAPTPSSPGCGVVMAVGSTSANLMWGSVAGATGYQLRLFLGGNCAGTPVSTNQSGTGTVLAVVVQAGQT